MSAKVTFSFFHGKEADQYSFYRIPKQLFTVEFFKGLSSDAKILYGLMLDRMSLSIKNQWFDEENRAYIYFSIEEVMEYLGCGRNKAVKSMKELDIDGGIGLIEKRRQGFGRSNIIYVKRFLVEEAAEEKEETGIRASEPDNYENVGSTTRGRSSALITASAATASVSENDEKQTSVIQCSGYDSLDNFQDDIHKTSQESTYHGYPEPYQGVDSSTLPENTRHSDGYPVSGQIQAFLQAQENSLKQTSVEDPAGTEVYNVNFKKSSKQISRSPDNKLLEVYKANPNYTYRNNTEYSYTKSHLIVSGDRDSLPGEARVSDAIRYDETSTETRTRGKIGAKTGIRTETEAVYGLIQDNIDLDTLLAVRQGDRDLILEIYTLITEMVLCKGDEIVIASNRYPAEIVRSRFLKLGYDHVNYVIDCFDKNTTKVKNIRKYLLASLFNAPATMDGYYRAEVRHDMPLMAQGLL